MKLKEPLTMELITVSSLTQAYVFPFSPTDSYFISKQLDFCGTLRTNKYLPYFLAYLFCVYFFFITAYI